MSYIFGRRILQKGFYFAQEDGKKSIYTRQCVGRDVDYTHPFSLIISKDTNKQLSSMMGMLCTKPEMLGKGEWAVDRGPGIDSTCLSLLTEISFTQIKIISIIIPWVTWACIQTNRGLGLSISHCSILAVPWPQRGLPDSDRRLSFIPSSRCPRWRWCWMEVLLPLHSIRQMSVPCLWT